MVIGYGRKLYFRMSWRPRKKQYDSLVRANWYNPDTSTYNRVGTEHRTSVPGPTPQTQEEFELVVKREFLAQFFVLDRQQQKYLFWLLEPQRMSAMGYTRKIKKNKEVRRPFASEVFFPDRATKK
jgi:hypothetical protein